LSEVVVISPLLPVIR